MRKVNIHEAKTHLSRLLEEAVNGESFIIAKSGKPLVTVTRIDAPKPPAARRTGFLAGRISIPDDFDQIDADEIGRLFDAPPQ